MKKLLTIAALAAITSAQSQVYLQGGANFSNITSTSSGQTEDNNLLTTYNAGILSRFDLSKTVDLEMGLVLNGKGSKAETYFGASTVDNYIKTKFNPLYLEIPLNVVLRFPLKKTTNIFLHGGPYGAMGVAGKATVESNVFGLTSTSTKDIQFSNDDPTTSQEEDAGYNKLKRFDLGINVGGGFDLGKIMLKANYGMGFTKINSGESDNSADDRNKYRVWSISLGVPIGR